MKMKTLNFGIIGCGVIADFHADAIAASKNGKLLGVVDTFFEKAENFSKTKNVKAYHSIDDMLNDENIHAVCICTPSGFHCETALKAINAGKHILIEKPIAVKNEDCKKICNLAKEKKVCAGAISQYRFSPAIQTLKSIIDSGKLGTLITADLIMNYYRSQEYYDSSDWRGTWELDGGSLMNQGIHGVDAMLYVMGDVKSVYGYTKTLAHNMEAEDTPTATLEFSDGALGIIQSSTAIYPGSPRNLVITGTNGTVSVKDDLIDMCDIKDFTLSTVNEFDDSFAGFNDPKNISCDGHKYQIQDFINAVFENRNPVVTLSDAKRTVNLINAVYESARKRKVIEIDWKDA